MDLGEDRENARVKLQKKHVLAGRPVMPYIQGRVVKGMTGKR